MSVLVLHGSRAPSSGKLLFIIKLQKTAISSRINKGTNGQAAVMSLLLVLGTVHLRQANSNRVAISVTCAVNHHGSLTKCFIAQSENGK